MFSGGITLMGPGSGWTREDLANFKVKNEKEVEDLLACLKSAKNTSECTKLFNRVSSVLVHDNWYSDEQQAKITQAAKESLGLTKNQKKLNLPEIKTSRYDSDRECDNSREYDYNSD
jgi:hypothetical protein